jgi:hypothetical protein
MPPGTWLFSSLVFMVIRIGVWRGWRRDQSRMLVRHAAKVRQLEVKSTSWMCSTLKPGFDIAAT